MFISLPQTSEAFEMLSWTEIEPWYRELAETMLAPDTLEPWLRQWSQGATRSLSELYTAAGATFAFDVSLLQEMVQLVTGKIEELEQEVAEMIVWQRTLQLQELDFVELRGRLIVILAYHFLERVNGQQC